MAKIEKLSPAEEKKLDQYCNSWLEIGRSIEPIDQVAVEAAVEKIYDLLDKPKPTIIYCQSPWQMAYTSAAFQNLGKLDVDQLGNQLESQLGNQLWNQLRSQLWNQLGNQLESQLGNQLESQLWNQLRSQLGNQLGNQLWNQLESQLWNQLRSQLGNQLWNQLRSQLWNQLESQLGNQLGNQLWNQLRSQLSDDAKKNFNWWTFFGPWYLRWLSYYDFPRQVKGFKYDAKTNEQLDVWLNLARNVAGWIPFDGICFVCDRPTELNVDDRGRLHSEDGPAIQYADGYNMFSVHGVNVTEDVVLRKYDVNAIEKEQNAEVRRVMIDLYGWEKYLFDSGAKVIHQDKFGILYRKEIPGDEPLVMVQVDNATTEGLWIKDGGEYKFFPVLNDAGEEYRKKYTLRVPPDTKTARDAIGWGFGMAPGEYAPLVES